MEHKQLSLHTVINGILYGAIALTPFYSEGDDAVWESDTEVASVIIPHVTMNYDRIVQEQEERYGIIFSSVPHYSFDAHPTSEANARYDQETGNIIFYTAAVFEEGLLAQFLTAYHVTRREYRKDVEVTVKHELGHDYFFERADAFSMKDYWDLDIGKLQRQRSAEIEVIEGVGQYTGGERKEDQDDQRRYDLVAPILSLDYKKGIDAIVQNPPLPNEWADLGLYTQRIVDIVQRSQ